MRESSALQRASSLCVCVVAAWCGYANAASTISKPHETGPESLTLFWENDAPFHTDNHYTDGIRLLWSKTNAWLPRWIGTRGHATFHCESCTDGWFLAIGQNMYTPDNISDPDPQPKDRPYVAWLYVEPGVTFNDDRMLHAISAQIGLMGPGAGGEAVQNWFHGLPIIRDHSKPAAGWKYQIRNEPGAVLHYAYKRLMGARECTACTVTNRWADAVTKFDGYAGNIITAAEGGIVGRVGFHISDDFGAAAQSITPVFVAEPNRAKEPSKWEAYVFEAVNGRAVVHNAFVEGSLFRSDSPGVQERPFVADFDAGGVFRFHWFRITLQAVVRSSEMKGSAQGHRYVSATLAWVRWWR